MSKELQTEMPFQPAEEFVIEDLETLKALTDPLRIQIIEHMAVPRTVKQVAKELAVAPTKLYYHINMLEERGLIRVTSTRIVSGIIEKQYQIAALRFRLSKDLVSVAGSDSGDTLTAMLDSIFDVTKSDIKLSVKSGLLNLSQPDSDLRTWQIGRSLVVTTPQQVLAFYERFEQLVKEYCRTENPIDLEPGEQVYAMTFVMYPTTYDPNKEETDEQSS